MFCTALVKVNRMSIIEASYKEMEQEMVEELLKYRIGFLATSEKDNVRVGNMFIVTEGLTIYCFTWLETRKYRQMEANPNVAFAIGNLQVEGVVSLREHPQDVPEFLQAYREKQPAAYERRSKTYFARSDPDVRVIEITPTRICRYRANNRYKIPESLFDVLDITKGEAYSVKTMDYFYARTPVYGE